MYGIFNYFYVAKYSDSFAANYFYVAKYSDSFASTVKKRLSSRRCVSTKHITNFLGFRSHGIFSGTGAWHGSFEFVKLSWKEKLEVDSGGGSLALSLSQYHCNFFFIVFIFLNLTLRANYQESCMQ